MSAEEGSTEKLIHDLNTLIGDAEELVKATGGKLAEKSKEELIAGLDKIKASCRRIESKAQAGAQNAQRYIRDNPYQSVGIAFGVGVLLGLLLSRD